MHPVMYITLESWASKLVYGVNNEEMNSALYPADWRSESINVVDKIPCSVEYR